MAVAKMKLVNIVGRLKDFDNVVQQCCIRGDFHPEMSSLAVQDIEEFVPIEESNPYERSTQSAVDIGVHSDIQLRYSNFDRLNMSFEELSQYIDKSEHELSVLNGRVGKLSSTSARLEQVLTSLSHLKNFGINLDELFGCKYIVFKFGRLPKESYIKISNDDEYDNRLFFPLEEDELYFWGFYVVKKSDEQESEEFYASLYFERIDIIEEAHGKPGEAQAEISNQLKTVYADLDAAKAAVKKYWSENEETYLKVYSNLRYLHDSFDIRRYAAKHDNNFYIFGWVPESEINLFENQFANLPGVDCIVENTDDAENIAPPTSLINNRLVKPFEMFVGMYGLPVYNEIDPTPFLALTYSIIFGIMFGDLGQGAIIFALGLYLWFSRKMPLGGILYRIGISSMIFGTLYNSVFGFENTLPFTILPVHRNENTILVLGVTIGLGILLILICMVFNIINGIRQKKVEKYLFSQNGFSGMIFYVTLLLSCVFAVVLKKSISPFIIILLILLPLLLIALKEPLSGLIRHEKDWKPKNIFEFAISAFFELFEALLSFATNTISFVRVGAYILSHMGMMIAIFALASLGGHGNNIIVLIIGNIFVMVLEGFVVAIQGIRLQYYEVFSRFYEGTGKEYAPVKIHYE